MAGACRRARTWLTSVTVGRGAAPSWRPSAQRKSSRITTRWTSRASATRARPPSCSSGQSHAICSGRSPAGLQAAQPAQNPRLPCGAGHVEHTLTHALVLAVALSCHLDSPLQRQPRFARARAPAQERHPHGQIRGQDGRGRGGCWRCRYAWRRGVGGQQRAQLLVAGCELAAEPLRRRRSLHPIRHRHHHHRRAPVAVIGYVACANHTELARKQP